MRLTCQIFIFFASTFFVQAQNDSSIKHVTGTKVYNQNIKSITVKTQDTVMSYPVIYLNSRNLLLISFDEIGVSMKNYYFKAIHCNADWKPSRLSEIEYKKGFDEILIKDVKQSNNTLQEYVHYNFNIPNDEYQLLLSGNYIVKVYEENKPDSAILEMRIIVVDNLIKLNAIAKGCTIADQMDISQEVNLSIDLNKYYVRDPFNDIKVVILQNGRWDNCLNNIKPSFVNGDELIYNIMGETVFEGGNEFRRFNFKSFKYITENVSTFGIKDNIRSVTLSNDKPRRYMQYSASQDFNGLYYIYNEQVGDINDSDIDAEYAWVTFNLKYDAPEVFGDIYVVGGLSNWDITDQNKMTYNLEKMQYELSMLLKQGYYDYQYAINDTLNNKLDISFIENSHWETENDYQVIVYHGDAVTGYDKIIGYILINNRDKQQKKTNQ